MLSDERKADILDRGMEACETMEEFSWLNAGADGRIRPAAFRGWTGKYAGDLPQEHLLERMGAIRKSTVFQPPMAPPTDADFLLGLADGARRSGRKDVADRLTEIAGKL